MNTEEEDPMIWMDLAEEAVPQAGSEEGIELRGTLVLWISSLLALGLAGEA